MKRFNGICRDRELVFKNLKKSDTMIDGIKHFTITPKNIGFDGKALGGDSDIKIAGLNK